MSDEVFVLRKSESGDWWIVPLAKAESFYQDELEGVAGYAEYVDIEELQIYEYEV